MKILVLTGGIGSGKSTVLDIIKKDYPQYGTLNADDVTRAITHSTGFKRYMKKTKIENFSKEIFKDSKKRKLVEQYVHWRVALRILIRLFIYWINGTMLVAVEIPIWFESNLWWLTKGNNILVISELEMKLARIKERNPYLSLIEIKERINAQLPDIEKILRADFVIDNVDNFDHIRKKTRYMLEVVYKPSIITDYLFYFIAIVAMTLLFLVILQSILNFSIGSHVLSW